MAACISRGDSRLSPRNVMPGLKEIGPSTLDVSEPGESIGAPAGGSSGAWPRHVWAEYLLLAMLAGLFLFRSFIPAWRSLNTDFRNYYVAARLYREGSSLTRVYDLTWFQRQKDHLGMERGLV